MRIKLTIEKKMNAFRGSETKAFGWIVKASNGDLPFETFSFRPRANAVQAIKDAYSHPTWGLTCHGGYWIETGHPEWIDGIWQMWEEAR